MSAESAYMNNIIIMNVEKIATCESMRHDNIIMDTADLAKTSEKVVQTNLICGTLNQRQSLHKCYKWCTQEQVVLFLILY